ncbi:MAG: glutamine--fructose-6-phosphate transaminase (isomerizing) [Candidatus Dependentiae bacterium]|jgi:glucosamine--fructose-6-phosphate aminotransferase (isomerizing)
MCGIVAVVGRQKCQGTILQGLQALEYRGYDSAGIACIDGATGQLQVVKAVGELHNLQAAARHQEPTGSTGIGHTRWATHGSATFENAHPHLNCHGDIAVVHNGIIEQCDALRLRLQAAGHACSSQTDTELVAHLFSDVLREYDGDLITALKALVSQLHGAFALVIALQQYPDQLLIVRRRSPLVLGLGKGHMMVASDQLALADDIEQVIFLPDESFGIVSADGYELFDFAGTPLQLSGQRRSVAAAASDKGEFAHYMLKEMFEQKSAIGRTVASLQSITPGLQSLAWQQVTKVYLIAAGTSWHAGRIAQFFFEELLDVPVQVHLASEFRYMKFFPDQTALYIFISQSGETADTLEALRLVNQHNLQTLALTNAPGSSIIRESNAYLLMQAGPEISVASTKAFSSQVASLYWVAHYMGVQHGLLPVTALESVVDQLHAAAAALESGLTRHQELFTTTLAPRYAAYDRMIFLGRHVSYPFALEAALKLKEISYIFAQCYPAGELKHGPIALIDSKTPVVLFSVLDQLIYEKIVANAQEVKARKGHLIIFAFEGQQELQQLADTCFTFPRVAPLLAPLAMTGMMQFFAYGITCALGLPIDKPRNLAKSVTVE